MTATQQLEYVAIIRNIREEKTAREYFRAPSYHEAKTLYAGRGNVESHVGPISIRIVGVVPICAVRLGTVVTILTPDDSIGEIGHIVSSEDGASRLRCFSE